ncbi:MULTISPECIES: hypothetical protein [Streptomycetaceae]|uniref:hypothetical protein n=1 Tax=Streptomycetaceae TaxID=2062 RepID=UPI00300BB43C
MAHIARTPIRPRRIPLFAPLPADEPSGQCSRCQQRFPGWNGGICDACKAVGR